MAVVGDEIQREAFERAVEDLLRQLILDDAEAEARAEFGRPATPHSVARRGSYPDTVIVVERAGRNPHTWEFDLWDPAWCFDADDPLHVATEMFLNCDD